MSLLKVKNLNISYPTRKETIVASQDVEFTLERGEILGIVGESGSGKSTIANAIINLIDPPGEITDGSIKIDNSELIDNEEVIQKIRGMKIGFVFQDPQTSLNPLFKIKDQLIETIQTHLDLDYQDALNRSIQLLEEVGIDNAEKRIEDYPHQFSGGMRQRVVIALAISCEPDLIIADEPTTALDVTVQQQILSLLNKIQKQRKMSILFISHDLGVVNKIADYIYVMKDGEIIEYGEKREIFNNPKNAYTKQLVGFQNKIRRIKENKEKEILNIKDLKVWYPIKKGIFKKTVDYVKAIDSINFNLKKKETIGIVGESGSGKTSHVLAILKLITSSGTIKFDELDLNLLKKNKLKNIRKDIQIVFQDPFSSLSPRMNVQEILNEGIDVHFPEYSLAEKKQILKDILKETGMDYERDHNKYPHEFSGGQRQRIAIARALILKPKILILDEPTSALDITIQNQILDLLQNLQKKYSLSYIFISHDMNVIRSVSDKILVLKKGKLIEYSNAEIIFKYPRNQYTKNLIQSVT